MKKLRTMMMIAAVVVAVGSAFATSYAKKYFVVAYVPPAWTSCQMTSKPDICNTIGSQFCTINGNTFYQNINMTPWGYFCVTEFRKD